MAAQSISRDECYRTHTDLNLKISDMHTDVKELRDNHIFHLQEKLDAQWKWIFIVAILSGIGLGIKALEIMGLVV